MHESSLARTLVELCLARAGGARVLAVHGRVAETEHLSREALCLHFEAHARGTLAEAARLELELARVHARCRGCGEMFVPEHHLLLCPNCGSTDAEQLGETGCRIDRIEVDAMAR